MPPPRPGVEAGGQKCLAFLPGVWYQRAAFTITLHVLTEEGFSMGSSSSFWSRVVRGWQWAFPASPPLPRIYMCNEVVFWRAVVFLLREIAVNTSHRVDSRSRLDQQLRALGVHIEDRP